jgi:2-amino-4-hydroxy-6-hydroxymethyldihydropteridine diphosphokinase
MVTSYLALGSNLGDPARRVEQAVLAIADIPQTILDKASSLYSSKPVDATGDDYVNAVVKIETELNAYELLEQLQQLEAQAGRALPKDRTHLHNAPRTLDLDILLYGEGQIESTNLSVPHPRMWQRAFVLVPLFEIAPELVSTQDLLAVRAQAVQRIKP